MEKVYFKVYFLVASSNQRQEVSGQFVKVKLKLSVRFRCDRIHDSHWKEFGRTLLAHVKLLKKSSILATA